MEVGTMKKIILVAFFLAVGLGCARVRVEAPKEPIKVDISMRLDIYQHVAKDIDDIESIVSGAGNKEKAKNNNSWLNYLVSNAYAQEQLSPDLEAAALRRKDRRPQLLFQEQNGTIGENKLGLVEIRVGNADPAAADLVKAENSDRMIIYQELAKKNGVSVEDVQKMYAKRLQQDAPSGVPIESQDASTGQYNWWTKP
jgi:uncharacterized protein YdbL (DUF1318 family)